MVKYSQKATGWFTAGYWELKLLSLEKAFPYAGENAVGDMGQGFSHATQVEVVLAKDIKVAMLRSLGVHGNLIGAEKVKGFRWAGPGSSVTAVSGTSYVCWNE